MDFRKQKPIYLQIADWLMEQVLGGQLKTDDRVPSVRDVATRMGVNPNTVVRSFDQLQQDEIIYQRRGQGYFVEAEAKERIIGLWRRQFIDEELPALRQRMQLLGLTFDELKDMTAPNQTNEKQ